MKYTLSKRKYYRLGRIFKRYNEKFNKISLKHKKQEYNPSLLISKKSNDDRYFFNTQLMDLVFYDKNSSQSHHHLLKKSNSSDIDNEKTRFVAASIVSRCICLA
jgi:hypothetical protein